MHASKHFEQVVGIIGGVGPEATSHFVNRLVKLRTKPANRDQDHIPYLLFNNPQIPDRTEFLLHGKESPLPELVHTAKMLKHAGATFICIICNTAHTFTTEIQEQVHLPVLNMIEITASHVLKTYGESVTVGLLATDGTIKTKLYQDAFAKIAPQVRILTPESTSQEKVMKAIYSIKAHSVNELNTLWLTEVAHELVAQGAKAVILGCTEIPLVFEKHKPTFIAVDPLELLAQAVIERTLKSKILPHHTVHVGSSK